MESRLQRETNPSCSFLSFLLSATKWNYTPGELSLGLLSPARLVGSVGWLVICLFEDAVQSFSQSVRYRTLVPRKGTWNCITYSPSMHMLFLKAFRYRAVWFGKREARSLVRMADGRLVWYGVNERTSLPSYTMLGDARGCMYVRNMYVWCRVIR